MCEGILYRITVFITTTIWKHPEHANVEYLVSTLCWIHGMEHYGSHRHQKEKLTLW